MKRTAMIIGAIGVAASVGVAAGSAVPTEPVAMAGDPLAEIPQHQPSLAAFEPRKNTGPNHYALETPEGRIEVHQLSDYGLYRNRSNAAARYYYGDDQGEYQHLDAAYDEPLERAERSGASPVRSLPVEIVGPSSGANAPIAAAAVALDVEPIETGRESLEAEPTALPVQTARAGDSRVTG